MATEPNWIHGQETATTLSSLISQIPKQYIAYYFKHSCFSLSLQIASLDSVLPPSARFRTSFPTHAMLITRLLPCFLLPVLDCKSTTEGIQSSSGTEHARTPICSGVSSVHISYPCMCTRIDDQHVTCCVACLPQLGLFQTFLYSGSSPVNRRLRYHSIFYRVHHGVDTSVSDTGEFAG